MDSDLAYFLAVFGVDHELVPPLSDFNWSSDQAEHMRIAISFLAREVQSLRDADKTLREQLTMRFGAI